MGYTNLLLSHNIVSIHPKTLKYVATTFSGVRISFGV